jgi:Holliday junction DNA helicase RuvA
LPLLTRSGTFGCVISFLKGTVRFIEEDAACVDVGGVGYRVLAPAHELARMPIGSTVEVYVHTHVREDAIVLFGFAAREGLAMFERLIGIQGVGPKTALALLSGIEPDEVVRAIAERDEARLQQIPGVGKKTAARIILELADKMAKEVLARPHGTVAKPLDDLRSALANLGYRAPQIDRAVQKVKPLVDTLPDDGSALPELVREALKHVA